MDDGLDDIKDIDLQRLKRWFRESRDATDDWREQAKEDYGFVAGHQWTDEEKLLLQDQLRPVVTFNRIDPMISAVQGTELQNRQEISYSPREMGDVKVNEIVSSAAEWSRDQCDAEFVESDAFGDLIICGMGWCEGNMDYVDEPNGKFIENRTDPLEMYWDTSARKKNIMDGRYLFRVKSISKDEAEQDYPDADPEDLHASWAEVDSEENSGERKNPNDSYKGDSSETGDDRTDVTIVEAQWWDKETYYEILDEADGQTKQLSGDEFKVLQKRYKELGQPAPKNIKRQRKIFRQAFIGKEILESSDLDCKQFKYKAMTGKRDRNKNVYYGLVRGMKDPQRWANKWLSQTLHIINSNAKGGVMAETDAVRSVRDFEENWSRPDKVSWLNPGGLAKIQQKQPITFPNGLDKLMEFAIASIRDTSGINLELLGLAGREQAGVLESQRKQAGMTILAHMFDSVRLMRREMGRLLLFYIQNYMSDGRLVRVVGKQMEQYVPLVKDQTIGEYDVVVDESPTSPNQKEQVFTVLMQVLPGMMKMGVPIPPSIIDYLPLPSSLTDEWKNYIQQQQEQKSQQPNPDMQKAEADIQVSQAKVQADIQNNKMKTMADIALQEAKQNAELAIKVEGQRANQLTQMINGGRNENGNPAA
jgi:hypothetical protein